MRGSLPPLLLAACFLGWPSGRAVCETLAPQGAAEAVVRVYTEPAGATIYVDGVAAHDLTPLEVKLSPGTHELRIEMDGYRTETRSLQVGAGEKRRVAVLLLPTPPHAAEDRKESFEGGYINAGAVMMRVLTSDIVLLGDTLSTSATANFRGNFRSAPGLAISLRYIQPLRDKAFLIVDTSYLDARLHASDVKFTSPLGNVDKVSLLLFRGSLEFSVGPNWIDYLLPYAGGGFSYTVIEDTDRVGWLGSDNQVQFTGYSLKAGVMWNSRHHLVVDLQGQYHWAYDLEDYMLVMTLGYKF